MLFALGIAGAYVWATRDVVGTVLLSMMAVAMIVVAAYIVVAEKESNLASDAPKVRPEELTGEVLGAFTMESYWPILGAAATALLVLGVVFLPGPSATAALIASALLFFAIRFMIREST